MKKCWECEVTGVFLHNHHPVPKSRGGTKTIPLCEPCHSKAHHRKKNMNTSTLSIEGLKRAKRRGVKLGNPTNLREAGEKGVATNISNADEFAQRIWPIIRGLQADGHTTQKAIAEQLNILQVPTARGGRWFNGQVGHIIKRMEKQKVST